MNYLFEKQQLIGWSAWHSSEAGKTLKVCLTAYIQEVQVCKSKLSGGSIHGMSTWRTDALPQPATTSLSGKTCNLVHAASPWMPLAVQQIAHASPVLTCP